MFACVRLQKVIFSTQSVFFHLGAFKNCDCMVSLADAAGFPSVPVHNPEGLYPLCYGEGVQSYLMASLHSPSCPSPLPTKIVIDTEVSDLLSSDQVYDRLTPLANGSVDIVINDDSMTVFGLLDELDYSADTVGWLHGCPALLHVDLSGCASLYQISAGSFSNCKFMRNIVLPDSLTHICTAAFASTGLESISFPSAMRYLGRNAFLKSALRRVTLNDGLAKIGSRAFESTAIESIEFPSSLTIIPGDLCACTPLVSVTLPPSIVEVSSFAFFSCFRLERVAVSSDSILFGETAFCGCIRLIRLGNEAGFPSYDTYLMDEGRFKTGEGVAPYLVYRFKQESLRKIVTVSYNRFHGTFHRTLGTEEEKSTAAKRIFVRGPPPSCFTCGATQNNLMMCNGCKMVHFCNITCQRNGWKKHRKQCTRVQRYGVGGVEINREDVHVAEFFDCCRKGGGTSAKNGVLATTLSFL